MAVQRFAARTIATITVPAVSTEPAHHTRYPNLDLEALPNIDSPRAIQQTLSTVIQALAANTISLYQAQTMIYALQLASNLS